MRMSDWSSDVCSSDLAARRRAAGRQAAAGHARRNVVHRRFFGPVGPMRAIPPVWRVVRIATAVVAIGIAVPVAAVAVAVSRSEEHTSELQSLMRISYAVFCLKKKNTTTTANNTTHISQIIDS